MSNPLVITQKKEQGRVDVNLGSLNGGLWLDLPPEDAPPQAWTDGYDFIVNDKYATRPRLGRKLLVNLTEDANLSSDFPTDERVYGLWQHRTHVSGANDSLLAVVGDQVARYDGTNWGWLGGGTPFTFANAGRAMFTQMGDLTDEYTIICVEGDKPLSVKQDGAYSQIDTSTGLALELRPKFCTKYISRLVLAGDDNNGTWVYLSDIADPNGWTTSAPSVVSDCQGFTIGDQDGDKIVGLVVKFGMLFIIKERSIWYLNGRSADDPSDWEIQQFTSQVGGAEGCGYTIADLGSDVLYASHDGDFRTLRDTQNTGLYATNSVSAKQIKDYLSGFSYDGAASALDKKRGWYLLAMNTGAANQNNGYVIYDYGKRVPNEDGASPGLWYRAAIQEEYQSGSGVWSYVTGRSCFAEADILGNTEDVISGGYAGCIFEEFGQTDEAKETEEASLEDLKIRAWLIGKHHTLEGYSQFDMYAVRALVSFDGSPSGSYFNIGAVIDPDERDLTVSHGVEWNTSYGTPGIWDASNWDEALWDVVPKSMATKPINQNGRTFAPYVEAYGATAEFRKFFVALRPGRT